MFISYGIFDEIRQVFLRAIAKKTFMIQCKICGTPLGKEPTTSDLAEHWKKHHSWHWEKNQHKTPEEALIKKR